MIADSLKNWEKYFSSSLMLRVLEHLNSVNENSDETEFRVVENGKFKTAIMTYHTKPRWSSIFESHQKFIDVQFTISGKEIIEVCDTSYVKSRTDYDTGKDVIYYYPPLISLVRVLNTPGQFVFLFPGEVHSAGISVGVNPEKVKKAVVKIDWDTFVREESSRYI